MPYMYMPPKVFMRYKGVTVWHFYKDGDSMLGYWYTLNEGNADEGQDTEGGVFDIRKVEGYDATKESSYNDPRKYHEHVMVKAIDNSTFDPKEYYPDWEPDYSEDSYSPEEIISSINGPLLREQRISTMELMSYLKERIADRVGSTVLPIDASISKEEKWLNHLSGISAMMDAIADCASDLYGKDCMISSEE